MDMNENDTSNEHRSCAAKVCRVLRGHILIISTVAAAFLGFGFGFAIRQAQPSKNALIWIGKLLLPEILTIIQSRLNVSTWFVNLVRQYYAFIVQ